MIISAQALSNKMYLYRTVETNIDIFAIQDIFKNIDLFELFKKHGTIGCNKDIFYIQKYAQAHNQDFFEISATLTETELDNNFIIEIELVHTETRAKSIFYVRKQKQEEK